MAAQPTEATLNCLNFLCKKLDKDTLRGVNWDQAAADAGMSSGRSFRDTMRRHCRKNGWFGETGAPSGTTPSTTAAAALADAATTTTTATAAASPAAEAETAETNAADAAIIPTGAGKRKAGMVLRSGRKRVKLDSSEEESEDSTEEEESEGEPEGEEDEVEELDSPSSSSSDSDSE